MTTLGRDIGFAIRMLRRDWMVTLIAVASLGIAIGGNGAVFSLVDAFLFRPLPFDQPERVVLVGERQESQPEFSGFLTTSSRTYADMVRRSRGVVQWAAIRPSTVSLRGTDTSEPISASAVTPGLFRLLGVEPFRGREFTSDEGVPGGPRAVILGHEFWVDRYGADRSPIGDVVVLNGEPHEIVGIAPPNFGFLTARQDVWTSLQVSPETGQRDSRNVLAVGRLEDGATTDQVRQQMRVVAAQLADEHPEELRGQTFDTYNVRHDIPLRQTRLLFALLQGSVALVLVIACVNITNLLLARGQQRSREIALRTVLGAHRGRIVRQLLTESGVLVAAGTVLALGIAFLAIRLISNQFASALPPGYEVSLDARVLVFTLLTSAAAGVAFGLAPAVQAYRKGQAQALRDGDVRGGSGRSRKRLSRTLVVAEIALSFVALGGGSLLVRSFLDIRSGDPGFRSETVLTALVTVPPSSSETDEVALQLRSDILDKARSLPGVETAAFVNVLPQSAFTPTDSFRVLGAPVDASLPAPTGVVLRASPEYLDVLGVRLVQGRFFADGDRDGALPVAVVNRSLAESHFPGGDAVGGSLMVEGETRTIVGVAEDVQQVLFQTPGIRSDQSIYLPIGQAPQASRLLLGTPGSPRAVADQVRRLAHGVDPDVTVSQVLTMDEYVEQFFVGIQVFNVVLGGFGGVALLLAALGTYGVLSYSVSQRRREIGIRMTVGAEPRRILRMVARQGLVMGTIGLVVGVLLMMPVIGLMQAILQGVSTVRPEFLVGVGLLLFVVTLAASLVPAGRAALVDPVFTLRDG